ncbi:MAG: 23S rRNA (adenine(2503)-C(2))-methyltransferase RlmN [Catonella sp.]|uniref:23S rRNA (adenine(2503)-C(2))-methyltransferase RlmN n=1 Tax=Catonella sp. TaxID=2382125 RepID=UPI003F9FAA15
MTNARDDIVSLNFQEVKDLIKELGEPAFRAKQIYEWIHKKLVRDYDEMTNVPQKLKAMLMERLPFPEIEEVARRDSASGDTSKFVFKLYDGYVIESVLMKYRYGNSVCISSQVGCRMGCTFCASTLMGLSRQLAPSEMLSQIYTIQRETGERVSNVVVMGTGEPLDNFDNLIKFIELLTDENGLNISQRNITVSTCGLTENIKKLADKKLGITLAISLHAPTDDERKRIMPIANKYTISEILEATDYYFEKTGRRISYEYGLIDGENDSTINAEKLSALLKGKNCHVNLIPINPIKERTYKSSTPKGVIRFKKVLENKGINVTIREEMGRDIDAACGQLRKEYMDRQ